jgi:hypothetical protein
MADLAFYPAAELAQKLGWILIEHAGDYLLIQRDERTWPGLQPSGEAWFGDYDEFGTLEAVIEKLNEVADECGLPGLTT